MYEGALTGWPSRRRRILYVPSSKGRTGISLMRRPEMSRRRSSSDLVRTTRSTDRTAHAGTLRPALSGSFCGGRQDAHGGAGDRAIQSFDSSVHHQWEPDALLVNVNELLGFEVGDCKPERCCIGRKWPATRKAPRSDMAVRVTA